MRTCKRGHDLTNAPMRNGLRTCPKCAEEWRQRSARPTPGWSVAAKGERTCRNCPRPAVHLHHIVPRSLWHAEARDNLLNGMPLCGRCHDLWHLAMPGAPTLACIRPREMDYLLANAPIDDGWLGRMYPFRPTAAAAR